jgi:hypothetical protein
MLAQLYSLTPISPQNRKLVRHVHKKQLPLSRYLKKIAQLGAYLARSNDSPPGNIIMWRRMRRLADMQLSFNLASERYG